jgi:hypothetical protein
MPERIYPEWPIKEGFGSSCGNMVFSPRLAELKPTYFHNERESLPLSANRGRLFFSLYALKWIYFDSFSQRLL